ncbi:MAG: Uma2 family endonuclease [Actinomycetota bacterium]|nr:Uma2 family endonuclease [Actinomycetota bacterium]
MEATAARLTVDEYLAASFEGDRTQLVDGVVVFNEPKLIHGVLQALVLHAFGDWIHAGTGRGLAFAPTNVMIDEYNLYAPDVLWIAERHVPADLDTYPERIPEICVEVRSPNTWRYDIGGKKAGYERAGLPELWLINDAARRVQVFRRSTPGASTFDVALELSDTDELASPQLPGFALPLERLFRD